MLVTGITWSGDFISGSKGLGDAFVAKLTGSGTLGYKVPLSGSDVDAGFDIAYRG